MSRFNIIKSWPFLAAVLLLTASQIFYLALSFSALQKLRLESSLKLESQLLENLSARLGLVVRTGRDLDRYPKLGGELERVRRLSKADYLMVVNPEGAVLGGQAPGRTFDVAGCQAQSGPPTAGGAPEGGDGRRPDERPVRVFQADGRAWLGQMILGRDRQPAAYVFAAPNEISGAEMALRLFKERGPLLIGITLFSILLLALALIRGQEGIKSGAAGRMRVYAVFLGPFLFGQVLFFSLVAVNIADAHHRHSQELAAQLANNLALDLEKLLDKHLPLADIPGLQAHLEILRQSFPLASAITVLDLRNQPVASAGEVQAARIGALKFLDVKVVKPLVAGSADLPGQGGAIGRVEVLLSFDAVSSGWLRLLLDNATMALVACLLMMELVRVIVLKLRAPAGYGAGPAPPVPASAAAGPRIMRPLIFGCLLALDMSLSFIPLKMAALNPELLGLPRELILGLPISVEMGMAGAAMVAGGFWAGHWGGWKPLFAGGALLAASGYALSAVSASAGFYILSRGLAGLGYGFLNIAAQIYVVERTDPGRQGEALGDLFAGFFSGGLCGCAAGGLLADRLGFTPVFFLSAALLLLLAGLTLLVPGGFGRPRGRPAGVRLSFKSLAKFVASRPIWNLNLLNVIPAAIATVGLLNYFLPIHLASLGAGPAVIGQLNVLFSLMVIFLGPRLGRRMDGSRRPWFYLATAGLLAAGAFFPFTLWPTVLGAVVGMAVLGLSNALSENGQAAYLLRRPEAGMVGDNQALGVYNAATRVGQVAGPMVLALAVGPYGLNGLALLGGGLAALSLLFWALAPKAPKPE